MHKVIIETLRSVGLWMQSKADEFDGRTHQIPSQIPLPAPHGKDWTAEEVKQAIKVKGLTLRSIEQSNGMTGDGLRHALRKDLYPGAEKMIATALGLDARDIWPSRWIERDARPTARFLAIIQDRGYASLANFAKQIEVHEATIYHALNPTTRRDCSATWKRISQTLHIPDEHIRRQIYAGKT